VNHRFLDVRVRACKELIDHVMYVEQLARQQLRRGRVEIALRTDANGGQGFAIDMGRAQAIYESLCALRDRIAPTDDVPFSLLASIPDALVADSAWDAEACQQAISQALLQALQAADDMRKQEGDLLTRDLLTRLETVRNRTQSIAARRCEYSTIVRDRLLGRVQQFISDHDLAIDPSRIAQEVILIVERSDIEEELIRLESHFQQFEALACTDEPVGRRLDFLLQEMGREINTVGSKSQDACISHAVVDIKAEIERMREQVQNVE
jgi:uncharacterized protein (TIGR00255 family)